MDGKQQRIGTKPQDAIGVVFDWGMSGPLAGWRLYLRDKGAGDWLSMKLVRIARGAGGTCGNYWVSWNVSAKRLNNSRATYAIPEAMRAALAADLASFDLQRQEAERADAAAIMAELEGDAGALSALMQ
jgi:hypothetical protein